MNKLPANLFSTMRLEFAAEIGLDQESGPQYAQAHREEIEEFRVQRQAHPRRRYKQLGEKLEESGK